MTVRQLKYFSAAAELGKISAAAVQLNVSQSAVTTAIRELEDLLGQTLFERHAHGVELTAAGRRFLGHCYQALNAMDEAMRMPRDEETVAGSLSIAATYTVLGYFLPYHLQRFQQRYPRIGLSVQEMNRELIEESLLANRCDMAVLLTSNVLNRDLALETFFGSERRLWVSSKHHLLERAEVTLGDVAAEPLIMLTVDEAAYTALRYWSETPYQPKIRLRTSSVEAVRSMVANGLGVAILSDMVYRPWSLEGHRIETINLKDRIPPMNIGLGWRKGAEHSGPMRAWRDYFRQLYLEPALGPSRAR